MSDMAHPHAHPQGGLRAFARAVVLRGHSPESVREIQAGAAPAQLTIGSGAGGWIIEAAGVVPEHFDLVWDGAALWVLEKHGAVAVDGVRVGGALPLTGRHLVEFGVAALCVERCVDAVAMGAPVTAPARPAAFDPKRTVLGGGSWPAGAAALAPRALPSITDGFGGDVTIIERRPPVQATMMSIDAQATPQGPWLRPRLGAEPAYAPVPAVHAAPTDTHARPHPSAHAAPYAGAHAAPHPSAHAVPHAASPHPSVHHTAARPGAPLHAFEHGAPAPPAAPSFTPPGSAPAMVAPVSEPAPADAARDVGFNEPPRARGVPRRTLALGAAVAAMCLAVIAINHFRRARAMASASAPETTMTAPADDLPPTDADVIDGAATGSVASSDAAPSADTPAADAEAPTAAAAAATDRTATAATDHAAAGDALRTRRPDGTTALSRAIDLVAEGRWAEAHREYQALAAEHPDDPDLAVIARILRRRIDAACAASGSGGASCDGR